MDRAQIATVTLSAATTLLVAFMGYYANNRLEEIKNEAAAAAQERTIQLEEHKLTSEQQARLEKILSDNVPKLVGENEQDRKAAVALLFILYPNDAKTYIDRATASLSEEQRAGFSTTIKQAEALDTETGVWTIVEGSDSSLEQAQFEAHKAVKQGFAPVVIFKRGNWYATTIGSYPSQELAGAGTIAVRANLRSNAFVVNLNSWCPTQTSADGYVNCAPKS